MGCTPGTGSGPALPQPIGGGGGSQVTLSPCASGPCINGGTCIPLANAFMCICPSGFSGFLCQNQIDNCVNSPCLNGATCVNQIGSFTCQCTSDFTGETCGEEVEGNSGY